jgi:hypothetical protein
MPVMPRPGRRTRRLTPLDATSVVPQEDSGTRPRLLTTPCLVRGMSRYPGGYKECPGSRPGHRRSVGYAIPTSAPRRPTLTFRLRVPRLCLGTGVAPQARCVLSAFRSPRTSTSPSAVAGGACRARPSVLGHRCSHFDWPISRRLDQACASIRRLSAPNCRRQPGSSGRRRLVMRRGKQGGAVSSSMDDSTLVA